jgi:transcriptional regulator with XRE-family HTH domain
MKGRIVLSEALRLLRVFHDLKQNELAARLQVSKSFISELEKGARNPSLEVMERYSKEFKIPISSILFFSENLENANNGVWSAEKAKRAIANKIIGFLQIVEKRTETDNAAG